MAKRAFQTPLRRKSAEQPVVSRLQDRFEDLDEGLELPAGPAPAEAAGASPAAGRAASTRTTDDLNLQLDVLRGQLDEAFDHVSLRIDEAETRASVAEARASVAEARASVAETRAGDAESRIVQVEERVAELAALLEALVPEDDRPGPEASAPTSLQGALDRLRERLEA